MAIRMKSISVPMPQKPTVQNFRRPEEEEGGRKIFRMSRI